MQQDGDEPLGDPQEAGDLTIGHVFEIAQGEDLGGARRQARDRQSQIGAQLAVALIALGIGR